jgi:hypothetical protein
MEKYIGDWLNLLLRWLHVITASPGSAHRSTLSGWTTAWSACGAGSQGQGR